METIQKNSTDQPSRSRPPTSTSVARSPGTASPKGSNVAYTLPHLWPESIVTRVWSTESLISLNALISIVTPLSMFALPACVVWPSLRMANLHVRLLAVRILIAADTFSMKTGETIQLGATCCSCFDQYDCTDALYVKLWEYETLVVRTSVRAKHWWRQISHCAAYRSRCDL